MNTKNILISIALILLLAVCVYQIRVVVGAVIELYYEAKAKDESIRLYNEYNEKRNYAP